MAKKCPTREKRINGMLIAIYVQRELIPHLRESFYTRRESFPLHGEMIPLCGDLIPHLRESFHTRREMIPQGGELIPT